MTSSTTIRLARCALVLTLVAPVAKLRADAGYHENFNGYATQSAPAGWVTSVVGQISSKRRAVDPVGAPMYRTAPDPTNASNSVFGTITAAGDGGTFSTLTSPEFMSTLDFSGRLFRGTADTRAGIAFFASYPEKDRVYLIGTAPSADGVLTMQLSARGAGTFAGTTDSRFAPDPNTWIRFHIVVATDVSQTSIRARFWPDGTPEPVTDTILATDADPRHLTGGRIGMWSAVSGAVFVDDLVATSSAVTTPGTPAVAVAIKAPSANQTIATAGVPVSGTFDNATAVTVNGVAATLDSTLRTFTATADLFDGAGTIIAVAIGTDGSTASASVQIVIDTRPPDVIVDSPAAHACIDASVIQVRGRAFDPQLQSVKVAAGPSSSIDAAVGADGTFTATFPAPDEAAYNLHVTAADTLGHTTTSSLLVTIDRTPPRIGITDSGTALDGIVTNHNVTPLVRVADADAATAVTTTLDGSAFTTSPIAAEGDHVVHVVAGDCAGHTSEQSARFTIDRTAPQILTIAPESDTTIGGTTALTGTVSPDTASLTISGVTTKPDNGAFAITAALAEGLNVLTIRLIDRAGNVAEVPYRITLKSTAPQIEIVESGGAIASGTLFNRTVTPSIRVNDPAATISATLNGAPFTGGTAVTADGDYTLIATARDAVGHSASATATFSIDTTPPQVKVAAPHDGDYATTGTVDVRGSVSVDAVALSVNGVAVAMNNGSFSTTITLDAGPNDIVVIARDRAGNIASDRVAITRTAGPRGIVLTAPADGMITNRTTTIVAGHLLTASTDATVTLNGAAVAVDASGAFLKTDFPLSDGENVIVASVQTNTGETNHTSVRVTADRTPPFLRLLESGQTLNDAARFADRAVINADATDGGRNVPVQLMIDGTTAAQPATITASGGHAIAAVARDAAGNESRIERTIFIGANGATGCALESFDPPNGAVVTATSVTVTGRSGGAAGVKINGIAAFTANGSFCGTVELPLEGDNTVTIVCTDAAGNVTGTNATLALRRVTGQPSITIATPTEGSPAVTDTVAVSGSVGAGVTSVDVNGVAAMVSGDSFTANGIRLSGGLNVIVARAMNGSARSSMASRRVVYLKDVPALAITSPAAGLTTGTQTIDINGIWTNLDPTTIAIAGASVQTTSFSDTSGTFSAANVPLTAGGQTISVTGHDSAGRGAGASVAIVLSAGAPSIAIATPLDNTVVGANAGDSFTVHGTFTSAPGATVDVDGVVASISGSSFTAAVPFSTLSSGITPVVARVTEPSGNVAVDTIRIQKLAGAPRVIDSFPAAAASDVDPGALPMVLFSAPMDRASLAAAFRLETSGGAPVSGTVRIDRDVLTFAPAAVLDSGGTYTVHVTTAAHDVAGNALGTEFATSFTVAASAPSAAPSVAAINAAICAQQQQVRGTAPANARVRLDYGSITLNTTSDANGAFTFTLPLSGQSGCQVARIRTTAIDGTLSPAAELRFEVDCGGAEVTGASFDRTANRLAITFSKEMNASTLIVARGGSVLLQLTDGRVVSGTVTVAANVATVNPAEDLTKQSFTLSVTPAAADTTGAKLAFSYTQTFSFDSDQPPASNHGLGFISGEVYDGETGRPLAGADVTIDVGTVPAIGSSTDARGRYAAHVPEGAHTIRVASKGFVSVWRQIVVSAGSGVVPIDVRLAKQGGANAMVQLQVPSGDTKVTLTSLSAQSLPGLLPLGWSPLAAADVDPHGAAIPGAELTFTVAAADVVAAAQTITVVRYREDRDEWEVITAVANVASDGKVIVAIESAGTYALVYGDRAPSLVRPPLPVGGAALQGVADPCASGSCPALTAKSFVIDPPVVLPDGRSMVTLKIDGGGPAIYPSGTAVQAYIDEDLQLADGTRVSDPPFTTDLLLYRNLAGDAGIADFQLAPSARAAEVVLRVGFDHIRILPYPGRVDRGTLVGPEGGRVPGDGLVSIDIPPGSTTDPVRATSAAITDFSPFGSIAGFTIAGGFTLTLQRASNTAPVELLAPARVTFSRVTQTGHYVLVEVLDDSPYGRILRLAAQMVPLDGSRLTTKGIDRTVLPVDGVVRDGRYLLLAVNGPIAFATGAVRVPGASFVTGARVGAPPLGVADVARPGGIFAIPVPATPAAPFVLVARTIATGDGMPYTHAWSPDADAIVNIGELRLLPEPPTLTGTIPADGATGVSLTTIVKATFLPAIDPKSVNEKAIVLYDGDTGATVSGRVTTEGSAAVVWSLAAGDMLLPNRRYTVVIAGSIRGTNGTPFGQTYRFVFSTPAEIASGDVHREKIRITIPDAEGRSRVIGDPGAISSRWQAVATRRGTDFVTRPQATAASDGSFAIDLPDRISLNDAIDLQVINSAGAIAAIISLTPFVSSDGKSFVAPPDRDVHFTSADGKASVTVPAGAFDEPTTITITPADQSVFADIPNINNELSFGGAVKVDFAGVAKKRLDIELAAPAGATLTSPFYLGRLGTSVRGPRVEIVDTLQLTNGRLTSAVAGGAAIAEISRSANSTFGSPQDVKNAMIATIRGGVYQATQFLQPTTWLVVQTPLTGEAFDLFSTSDQSIYLDGFSLTEKRGRALFPVAADKPFQLVGYDSSTGIEVLRVDHTGVDALDPLNAIPTVLLTVNDSGPYPVSATAARLDVVDVAPENVELTSVAGLTIKLAKGQVSVAAGDPPLAPGTRVDILDVTNGQSQKATAVSSGGTASLPAAAGDRLLIATAQKDVDPDQIITFAFSSAIDLNGAKADEDVDAFLQAKNWIRIFSGGTPATLTEVTRQAQFTTTGDARRVIIHLPLRRGDMYRVVISGDLSGPPIGTDPGLKLGQRKIGGSLVPAAPNDMTFEFSVREPGGELARLTLPAGFAGIRDFALTGNVAFVATMTGGLEAYDVSDPGSLADVTSSLKPKNLLRRADGAAEYWNVNVDRHGRVYATGMTPTFGVVHAYRLEDFVNPPPTDPRTGEPPFLAPTAGAIVSWRIGINAGVPVGTETMLTDRPEAIPRKMQVLLQDSENRVTRDALEKMASGATPLGKSGFDLFDVSISAPSDLRYWNQRVTIENRTIGAHWSADIHRGTTGTISSVIARVDDELVVVRNNATYGVVSLFGYGVGVYDLNAIESNDQAINIPENQKLSERVLLTAANGQPDPYFVYPTIVYCEPAPPPPPPGKPPAPCTCNPATRAPKGEACDINDLTFSPDALIFPSPTTSAFDVYAVDLTRGLLDFEVTPLPVDPGPPPVGLPPRTILGLGLSLSEPFATTNGTGNLYHPRLRSLHNLYIANAASKGVAPRARFTSVAAYLRTDKSANPQNYALLAGNNFGLMVVKVDGTGLRWESLVDVVWIPAGALAVRVIPRSDFAVVIDNAGRVLLVDLKQIDESDKVGALPKCTNDACAAELFPTAKKSIMSPTPLLPPAADWIEVGVDDPRVVWKTAPHTVAGNIAPVIDAETGILLTGDVNGDIVRAIAAIDPRVQFRIQTDDGPRYVNSIVPLGIEPKAPHKNPETSYGAFKVELTLPGSIVESIARTGGTPELRVAVESERVVGSDTEQTVAPLPPAHLRQVQRDGTPDLRAKSLDQFKLQRLAPYDASDPKLKLLRYQRAYNSFVSPWVVAIADPRASEQYNGKAGDAQGCFSCQRPLSLRRKNAPDVYELFTRGRVIAVRPELGAFTTPAYKYLGDAKRLEARAATWVADTTRPPEVAIAPQNPPLAGGALLETVYLHSGEVETSAVDIDAGGRNGFNVVIGRFYRSRSYGFGALGPGWDSPMFKRLRELPLGDVEYRDGAANVWRFRISGSMYVAPNGLFVSLARNANGGGWTLRDQRGRVWTFDAIGRIVNEGDEYFDPASGSGNALQYRYDSSGRLSTIVDPLGRTTQLTYFKGGTSDGLLQSAAIQWRNWTIDYRYDTQQRLTNVLLPNVMTASGSIRPTTRYDYQTATSYDDLLDLGDDLKSITDPNEVVKSGKARVAFRYDTNGSTRDCVTDETWATGETVHFGAPATKVTVHDALGQDRIYTIDGRGIDAHVSDVVEQAVTTSRFEFGKLPKSIVPGIVETEPRARHWHYAYDLQGLRSELHLIDDTSGAEISSVQSGYVPAAGGAPGFVPQTVTTSAPGTNTPSITQKFEFSDGAFLKSVGAGSLVVETPEPTRENVRKTKAPPVISNNDKVTAETTFDGVGRVSDAKSGGGSVAGGGSKSGYKYKADNAAECERGEVEEIRQGDLVTRLSYTANATTITDPRGILTVIDYDEWQRPAHVSRIGPGLSTDQRYTYDASGRIARQEEKQGTATVTTEFAYDEVGRQISISRDKVVVRGTPVTQTTRFDFDLTKRTLTTTLPAGSTITRHLDSLGRVDVEITTTGGQPIEQRYAYDIAGNRVLTTDMLVATASAFDVFGREVATLNADGTRTTRQFDDWGRPRKIETISALGVAIERSEPNFTATGRLASVQSAVDPGRTRKTSLGWDGAGRTTSVAVDDRATLQEFDDSGRLVSSKAGEGTVGSIPMPVVQKTVTGYDGPLAKTIVSTERTGGSYETFREFDADANVTTERVGGKVETNAAFDELGNVTSSTQPHAANTSTVSTTAYGRDSTGALTKETLADKSEIKYEYDSSGALSRYTDPVAEATQTDTDLVGRPLKRVYPDTTTETFEYDGDRLHSYSDRQNRTQIFTYNVAGQLTDIDRIGSPKLDHLEYDDAGRLIRWTNKDSGLAWGDFNFDGKPRKTTLTVYKDGTGFTTKQIAGEFMQEHVWNEHGERTEWSMPRPAGFATALQWTDRVRERRDALGNVSMIERNVFGAAGFATILDAEYQNAGRPGRRTLTTAGSASIVRRYGYEAATGMLNEMEVSSGSTNVGGTHINDFDGVKIHDAQLLGVSAGARTLEWSYDTRLRLQTMSNGRATSQGLTQADFRSSLDRTPRFDAKTREALAKNKVDVNRIDPPSQTAWPGPGQKVQKTTDSETRDYSYNGSELTDDGRFTYEWDEKGRLIRATQKNGKMRVTYTYDGNDRMITRRVETGISGEWTLATPTILTDGIPADAIFTWDPFTDRIVAVFDATGALSRQILHGGLGYDDPIEVTLTEPADISKIDRLYPVFDEAGAGHLQSVLNVNGEIVSRKVMADAFGDETLSIGGAAVDRVQVTATKDSAGAISSMTATVRSTEQLRGATIAAGMRLAALDSYGDVIRTAKSPATLADAYTAKFSLSPSEWSTLTNGATAISIAVTKDLRATAWSADVPLLPAPEWARVTKPIFSNPPEIPIEVRESLANLSFTSLGGNGSETKTLYEVTDIALLGSDSPSDDPARFLVTSPFHALPFYDRVTHLTQVRARWLSHATGTSLSPDPMQYRDSSNLYSYCAGDPVNGRDPTGLATDAPEDPFTSSVTSLFSGFNDVPDYCRRDPGDERCTNDIQKWFASHFGDRAPEQLVPSGYGVDDPIIYINGVGTTRTRASQIATRISDLEHRRVVPVWNPSTFQKLGGKSVALDVVQTLAINKTNVPDNTTRLLVSTIRQELAVSPTVTVVAHSQGAAVTSSALHALRSDERARINVITLGGAAYTYPAGLKSLRVIVNVKDPVPWVAGYSAVYGATLTPTEMQRVDFGTWRDAATFNVDVTHNVETYVTFMHGILARERAQQRMHRWP